MISILETAELTPMNKIRISIDYKPVARFARLYTAILLLLGASHPLFAQSASAQDSVAWQALKEGTAVALMRHALAPGVGDPPGFEIGNCATQRNLSAEGKEQARLIGEMLRSNGVQDAEVFTSEWCRCQETAQFLELGEIVTSPMLNSFFQNRSSADQQTRQLRESIKKWTTTPDGPKLLVTHQVNISALTGEFTSSGETVIVSIIEGDVKVLHRIPG